MSSIFSLKRKTAVVTGGAKGIGESICKVFARQGAAVHVLDIDVENGRRVVDDIRCDDGSAFFHACDVVDSESVKDTFSRIYDRSGRLDILVNNAGIAHIGTAESTHEADFDRIYQTNIKSVYHCIHHAIPLLKQTGGGAILNMASVASVTGIADRFAYSTSKGAVLTMTYSVAKDFLIDNIRCNAIGPGRVHTPFVDGFIAQHYPGQEEAMFEKLSRTQPIGRMGKPEEIAHLALYLCSDEAAFITGNFYPIDGGFITLNT